MRGSPKDDLLETIKQIVKELHIQAREAMTDEELQAAIAFFRSRRFSGRIPSHDDMALLLLLQAFRKFRDALPFEPGDSPFEYRK